MYIFAELYLGFVLFSIMTDDGAVTSMINLLDSLSEC